MNKPAIKNFAIWARNKLIADIQYRAGLMGITAEGIKSALPQSTAALEFYDIGTAEPYSISGDAIRQRGRLVEIIRQKEKDSDYPTAYKYILEEVAYTWFNRLIAIRFMEVNDYLPSHIRVLSSESGKVEPDLVTTPFDAGLDFSPAEEETILRLKTDNQLDELFRLLFVKQCNALNEILPALFEPTSDYTELLLNLSVVDQEGVVYRLVHDIAEDDFNVEQGGQVEIIGWLYQYYNTELNEQVYDGNMSKSRIPKELLPAATTIYTPDWPVRYMVENSLGRLWLEGHPNDQLKSGWRYYLDEAEQEPEVEAQLAAIRAQRRDLQPQDIKFLDPCMGSGHILVYAFEVLMQIYESQGWSQRDAAQSILEHNLYGLDIDDRAAQLAYFAVMMKARQYDRRILTRGIRPNLYGPAGCADGQEYGSLLMVDELEPRPEPPEELTLFDGNYEEKLNAWNFRRLLAQQYDVVVTNPPYLGSSRFSPALDAYVKKNYTDEKADLSMAMFKQTISSLCKKDGFVAFIITSSWMFLSSFENLRKYIQASVCIDSLVDFGTELFDGKVGHNPIVSWVTRNSKLNYRMTAIRLVDYCYSRRDEKEPEFFNPKNRYTAQQSNFSKIPGAPVAYWVSEAFYKTYLYPPIGDTIIPRHGLATSDNNRFLKLWFEVSILKTSILERCNFTKKWYPMNKGGAFRKWYGNLDWIINYENDGKEIKDYAVQLYKSSSRTIQNTQFYFKEGITWSALTSGALSFRWTDIGSIFGSGAHCAFASDSNTLLYGLALLNGTVSSAYLSIVSPTLNTNVDDIRATPYIEDNKQGIVELTKRCIAISKLDWDSYETSWDFKRHPLV